MLVLFYDSNQCFGGMARTIAIGDIHGCLDAFDALLEAISPQPEDTIVTLGDYVDRGPNSKGVLDRLLELEQQVRLVPLRGNHEDMLIEVLSGQMQPYAWLNHGGVDTMDSYGFVGDLNCIPKSHLELIDRMPNYFETETHFCVHANYDETLPLEEQPDELLRWTKISQRLPPPHFSGKKAVVGHTHDREGRIFEIEHLVCIDTYCYGGKWLTALELETGQIWQSTPSGELVRRTQ
jgi:serine/threonine protein phosphatase 1